MAGLTPRLCTSAPSLILQASVVSLYRAAAPPEYVRLLLRSRPRSLPQRCVASQPLLVVHRPRAQPRPSLRVSQNRWRQYAGPGF